MIVKDLYKKPGLYYIYKKARLFKIVVQGEIDEEWSERQLELKVHKQKRKGRNTISSLRGRIIDQSALSSIMKMLYDKNMKIKSVNIQGELEKG